MTHKNRRFATMAVASALTLGLVPAVSTAPAGAVDYNLPSLWQEYRDYFIMGTFGGWNGAQALYHYRTNSPSNDLKLTGQIGSSNTNSLSKQKYDAAVAEINADASLDEAEKAAKIEEVNATAVVLAVNPSSLNILNQIRAYNETNNLGPEDKKVVRAHVLAWHGGQQPNYFFCNGFAASTTTISANMCPNGLVTKATMLKRLDTYIKLMMQRYAPYNDVIYSWDVVNEPIDDYSGQVRNGTDYQPGQWGIVFRTPTLDANPDARLSAESAWIRQAFASARKWSNEYGADWKLYLNDFQDSNKLYEPKMTQTVKVLQPIYAAGNIDGYGMQARLAWAYPTIDMLRNQIELGLTVADEISMSESDIRSDFEPNPDYDPNLPTRRVVATDPQYPEYGSGSVALISQGNGNTYDVFNSPVRRIPAWGTALNNTLATSDEIMKKQADFAADWMDVLIEYKDKVVAYQWDGTSDSGTFNRTTGGHLWAGTSGNPEKYSFFATIGAPNRDKLRQAIAAPVGDEADYSTASWTRYTAALAAAAGVVDDRVYTMADVTAVKEATAALKSATAGLVPLALSALYAQWSAADLELYTASTGAALAAALAPVGAIVDGTAPADTDVAAATLALQDAIAGLVPRATAGELQVLRSVVTLAAQYEALEHQYTAESFTAFIGVLGDAKTLLADPTEASAAAIAAAATALQTAITGLVATVDTSLLRSTLATADEYLAQPGKYLTPGIAALTTQVEAARALLATSGFTEEQVNNAFMALVTAFGNIVEKGDTTGLTVLANFAAGLVATAYTPGSFAGVAAPLAAAQAVIALPEASKAQVADATDALSAALDSLILRPSKVALASVISVAAGIAAASASYIPASLEGLPEALASARAVYDNAEATAAQVSGAQAALLTEVLQARLKPVTASLLASISAAQSNGSAAVAGALATAKAVAANPSATQEAVDAAAAALDSAVAASLTGADYAAASKAKAVAKLTVAKARLVLKAGAKAKIGAKAFAASGKAAKVTYKSSKPKVAKVSKSGKVTAKKAGQAVIKVKAAGKTVKVKVRVK